MLLGSAAAAWPLNARAQQPGRMRRGGVFTNLASDDPEAQARIGASTQGLHVRFDYLGRPLIIPVIANAAELVALGHFMRCRRSLTSWTSPGQSRQWRQGRGTKGEEEPWSGFCVADGCLPH